MSSERGERERKLGLSFSYGKCFSYKCSFLTSGMFHTQKVAARPCQFLQYSKGWMDGLIGWTVEGKVYDIWSLGSS